MLDVGGGTLLQGLNISQFRSQIIYTHMYMDEIRSD